MDAITTMFISDNTLPVWDTPIFVRDLALILAREKASCRVTAYPKPDWRLSSFKSSARCEVRHARFRTKHVRAWCVPPL